MIIASKLLQNVRPEITIRFTPLIGDAIDKHYEL